MKYLRRKIFREIRQAKWQFLSLVIIIGLGAFFYVGLTGISTSLQKYVEPYYQKYHLSDGIVYFDSLPDKAVMEFAEIKGVKKVEARQVTKMSLQGELQGSLLVHTIPVENEINQSVILEGKEPDKDQVLIDSFFAKANQLKIGDEISLNSQDMDLHLSISGFCENVEHGFNIENPSMVLPDRKTFGIAYIQESSLKNSVYNQLLIDLEEGIEIEKVLSPIEKKALKYSYRYTVPKESMTSYKAIQRTMDNNRIMSLVTPFIFFTISTVIIFLTLSRLVDSQRHQIGIMKALGVSKRNIFHHYVYYPVLTGVLGSVLGFVMARLFFCPVLDDIGQKTYSLPGFHVTTSLWALLPPLFLSICFGTVACYLSLRRSLSSSATELMKPKSLKASGPMLLEKWPVLWSKLSYHRKLLLRNLSINKLKFFTGFLGVFACVILIVTALGFQESMDQMASRTEDMYTYDMMVQFKEIVDESVLKELRGSDIQLLRKLHLQWSDYDNESIELFVLDENQDHFHFFDKDHKAITLPKEGILLPESFAKKQDISLGQVISTTLIFPHGGTQTLEFHVSGLTAQYTSPVVFASKEYITGLTGDFPENAASIQFGQGEDVTDIQKKLMDSRGVIEVSTKGDLQRNITNLIQQNKPVFSLFILVALVLSFGAIFTLSSINIRERRGELSTLKVLGFSRKRIRQLIFHENYFVTVTAIVFALPFSVLCYDLAIKALSSSGQMIPHKLHGPTILTAVGVSFLLTVISNQLVRPSMRQINMVESLKQVE